MYAILIDVDVNCLSNVAKTYSDVRRFLEDNNFTWKQGGLFFGNEGVNSIDCVLVIQKLVKTYPWVVGCAKDIRLLRIEENSDLLPAI